MASDPSHQQGAPPKIWTGADRNAAAEETMNRLLQISRSVGDFLKFYKSMSKDAQMSLAYEKEYGSRDQEGDDFLQQTSAGVESNSFTQEDFVKAFPEGSMIEMLDNMIQRTKEQAEREGLLVLPRARSQSIDVVDQSQLVERSC